MEVSLYVYDLSRGLARQWSLPLTGTQIDAIYHTSLVFGGVEFYFGSGVQRAVPGSTHHGQPMQVISQGSSEIPMEVVEEYMASLAEIYTAESYDLFLHNCNNFTQDLSIFLTGKEIPEHIRQLPQNVLDTPFGQMLRPQIDRAMRGVTQGGQSITPNGISSPSQSGSMPAASHTSGSLDSNKRPENTKLIHPHQKLKLPTFSHKVDQYVLYKSQPPLEKLIPKLGDAAKHSSIDGLLSFVKTRNSSGAAEAPLPFLPAISKYIQSSFSALDKSAQFALVDLLRIAFADARMSGYFAEEKSHLTLHTILSGSGMTTDLESVPYNLLVVTLQLLCNSFSSPLYPPRLVAEVSAHNECSSFPSSFLTDTILPFIRSCLIVTSTSTPKTRATAAAFVYNLAAFNHNARLASSSSSSSRTETELLSGSLQTELTALLLEALEGEIESVEALHGQVAALGMLVHLAPLDGEVWQLCGAMEAREMVIGVGRTRKKEKEKRIEGMRGETKDLIEEVGEMLGVR